MITSSTLENAITSRPSKMITFRMLSFILSFGVIIYFMLSFNVIIFDVSFDVIIWCYYLFNVVWILSISFFIKKEPHSQPRMKQKRKGGRRRKRHSTSTRE
jgi:hypothetical protein